MYLLTNFHLSHNGSYADDPIADTATATNNDFGDATTYGDVFVEISTETMQEVECQGVKCYVACSCNTDEGWFDTPAGARNGDTNAEVYTVTSEKHYSLSSVSTSSIDDITISTMSTNANQTPITTASTRSMFSAPSLRTASASSTKATCYKKKTCGDMGYYDDVDDIDGDYFKSDSPTDECYRVSGKSFRVFS